MTAKCPMCGSDKFAESVSAVELDAEGIPYAAAVHEGYGVPMCFLPSINLRPQFFVDDQLVSQVVAYDRREGWLVRHKTDENGKLITDGKEVAQEKLTGTIRVENAAVKAVA